MVKRPQKQTSKRRVSPQESRKIKIAKDKTLSDKKHTELLGQIFEVITPGITAHQNKAHTYTGLLIALAAMPSTDGAEKAKAAAYAAGESTVVGDTRYPAALGHLNSVQISLMQVLFPARQMYGSVELEVDKQKNTSAIVAAMNVHSKQFRHYTSMGRVIMDALALNVGIVVNSWETQRAKYGEKRLSGSNVTQETSRKTVFEGTKLRHCDPMNTILQPGIHPEDYQFDAQYYAYVEQVTEFDLVRMAEKGEVIFAKEHASVLRKIAYQKDFHGGVNGEVQGSNKSFYEVLTNRLQTSSITGKLGLYNNRPNMHRPILANAEEKLDVKAAKSFDYNKFASDANAHINYEEVRPECCNELLTVVMRGRPEDFGLSSDKEDPAGTRVYQFKILNGSRIIGMREISTSHGMMNIAITRPFTELGRHSSLSLSEKLLPFQEASSSLLNTFIRKARASANNGMTYVIEEMVNMNNVTDPSTGMIGVSLEEMKKIGIKDIRGVVQSVGGDSPDRSSLLGIDALNDRMQDVVPTDAISQTANLNRPVAHQSRRLAELQNLHVYSLARIIHEEMMMPTTHMHTQDTLSLQKEIQVVGADGNIQTIDPSVFKDTVLDVAVSDGMRGLDTLAVADRIEKVLQYAFQSRRVQNDIDVVKLTSYLLKMDGANIDLNMFRYENEFDKLSPEAKQQAYELLAQAAQAQGGEA